MSKVFRKIKSIIIDTKYNIINFGFIFGCHFFICSLSRKFMYLNRRWAIKILEKELEGVIYENKYHYSEPNYVDENQKTIYFFWAQGIQGAPILIKKAISLAKEIYSDYHVIILTMDNYQEYVDIDESLIEKYNSGLISIQTLSDIIRFNLLYQNGGIWMDATLFSFSKLPLYEMIQDNGFYSTYHSSTQNTKIWGKVFPVKYTTYFLCAKKGSAIMKTCSDMYNEFYRKYSHCIDYFMIDYFLIICMKNQLSNNAMEKVPFTKGNPYCFEDMIINNNKHTLQELELCPQKCNWRNINDDKLCLILEKMGFNYENTDCLS